MKNPYTIDRLLQKADFLGMYTIRSEANLSGYIYNDGEIAIVANGEICRMPLKIFLEMASEMPGVAEDIKDLQRMGGVEMIRTSFKECRYCNERYPGCHDECTRYKAAKAEYDRQKQIASKKRIHEGEVVDFFKVSCCRKRGR